MVFAGFVETYQILHLGIAHSTANLTSEEQEQG